MRQIRYWWPLAGEHSRLIGVVMQDAVIDGLVTNLVVNGVEMMS